MKKLVTLIIVASLALTIQAQNITNTPGTDGDFVINSTTGGLLIPTMTETQKNAIGSPATGLMIYQTDATPGYYYNAGTAGTPNWVAATGAKAINDLSDGKTTAGDHLYLGSTASSNPAKSSSLVIGSGVVSGTGGTTGMYNTYIGIGAGAATGNVGFANTAVGALALNKNTSGQANVAIGEGALRDNTSGNDNIALGAETLKLNTDGIRNIGIGNESINLNVIGNDNVAIGFQALNKNTNNNNIGIGTESLFSNNTGINNIGIGTNTLHANVSGHDNIAIGYHSLPSLNNDGNNNIGIGNTALNSATSGDDNIAIGEQTLWWLTTGVGNIAIGDVAGANITTGNYNTIIGPTSASTATMSGNVIISNGQGITRIRALENGYVGINELEPHSSFQVSGSIARDISAGSGNHTLSDTEHTFICNEGGTDLNIYLPDATDIDGRIYIIKSHSTPALTVHAFSGQTIDGQATYPLTNTYDFVRVQAYNGNWFVIGK